MGIVYFAVATFGSLLIFRPSEKEIEQKKALLQEGSN